MPFQSDLPLSDRQSQPQSCLGCRGRGNGQIHNRFLRRCCGCSSLCSTPFPRWTRASLSLYSFANVPWPGSSCWPSSKVSIPPHRHMAHLDISKIWVYFFMQNMKWGGCASAYSLGSASVCIHTFPYWLWWDKAASWYPPPQQQV